METTVFVMGLLGLGVYLLARLAWAQHRFRQRRKTLQQDGQGLYVWVDLDGSHRSSQTHPDAPGGAWFVDTRVWDSGSDHSGADGHS